MTEAPQRPQRDVLEDWLTQYVLGQLGARERAHLERLIADDRELAREVTALRRTLGLLPLAAETDPPPHLREAIVTAARTAVTSAAAPVRSRQRRPRRHRVRPTWSGVATALAASAALALAWDGYRLRRELSLQHELQTLLQQPNVVLSFDLGGTGEGSGAYGSVVLDLDAKKGAVALRRLPALPEGKVFRLWAVVGDKTVPCGQFRADPQGNVTRLIPIPVDAYTEPIARLILTSEAREPDETPAGPLVMTSS